MVLAAKVALLLVLVVLPLALLAAEGYVACAVAAVLGTLYGVALHKVC
jgi:hypothetical protein